jgi:uncharacterized protein (DUF3820 family)
MATMMPFGKFRGRQAVWLEGNVLRERLGTRWN